MTHARGPHNRGHCPFYIVAEDPLSAQASVIHCVECVIAHNERLIGLREDFQQIAYLVILESLPDYDPLHPSGATLTTFIKARVCTQLWKHRRKELAYIPFSHTEEHGCAGCGGCENACGSNALVNALQDQACSQETLEDKVIDGIEVENLRKYLPHLMENLTENERRVIQLKFFDEQKGATIANTIGISQGRVSQLTKSALAKVGKAYFTILGATTRNPYI